MAEEEKKGSELAKVEPEVKVLSPVEKAEGDKRFEAKITQLLIEEKDVTKAVLYHHWRKGEFITELRSNPEKWGNHTIDDLFTRFNAGKTTINAWQNFYLKYEDKNKLQELADSGATWRDVYNVLTIADDKQREDLLQKRITNTIDSVKLAKQVKKINAAARGKKPKAKNTRDTVTQRAAQSALNTVRSSNEVLLTAISSMDEFREAYDEFQKMEEGKLKSDIQASLQDNFRNISILNKKLVWILEYRDKLLAKRKAAAEAAKKS
jgi:hypothetical protein